MSPDPLEPLEEIKQKLERTSNGKSLATLQEETVTLLTEVKALLGEIKTLLTNLG